MTGEVLLVFVSVNLSGIAYYLKVRPDAALRGAFDPGKPFQPCLKFVDEARSLT
jgi:hypothetical protein